MVRHHGEERVSKREFEVWELTAKGFSMKEIANSLKITLKTVSVHRMNLVGKLGMRKEHGLPAKLTRLWLEGKRENASN